MQISFSRRLFNEALKSDPIKSKEIYLDLGDGARLVSVCTLLKAKYVSQVGCDKYDGKGIRIGINRESFEKAMIGVLEDQFFLSFFPGIPLLTLQTKTFSQKSRVRFYPQKDEIRDQPKDLEGTLPDGKELGKTLLRVSPLYSRALIRMGGSHEIILMGEGVDQYRRAIEVNFETIPTRDIEMCYPSNYIFKFMSLSENRGVRISFLRSGQMVLSHGYSELLVTPF